MNHYVADTHALFWYLTNSPRLGARASAAFDEGARGPFVFIPFLPEDVLDFDATGAIPEMHDRIIVSGMETMG